MQTNPTWPYFFSKPKDFEKLEFTEQRIMITTAQNSVVGILMTCMAALFFGILKLDFLVFACLLEFIILSSIFFIQLKIGFTYPTTLAAIFTITIINFYASLAINGTYFIYLVIPLSLTALLESRKKIMGISAVCVMISLFLLHFFLRGKGFIEIRTIPSTQLEYINVFVILNLLLAGFAISYNWIKGHYHELGLLNELNKRSLDTISNQQKDMEDMTVFLKLISKWMEDITSQIESSNENGDVNDELKTLLEQFKGETSVQDKLFIIYQNVDTVNHQFYQKIEQHFGKLSKSEKEICALIRLNFSTKEIANIRNTSEGTIYVTKNRLKNKYNQALPEDFDLDNLIQNV